MSKLILSILIPTVTGRVSELSKLLMCLRKQIGQPKLIYSQRLSNGYIVKEDYDNQVQVVVYGDDKSMTIGEKREKLYHLSDGVYSFQVDDDDLISDDAISLILEAAKYDADCITFKENCMINGRYYSSNHSLKYDDWSENRDGFDYVRTPFYKNVIKTEIAKNVHFSFIRYGEDHAWAISLKPHLKNEYHIDKEIYYYIHNSKPEDHNERYGIV